MFANLKEWSSYASKAALAVCTYLITSMYMDVRQIRDELPAVRVQIDYMQKELDRHQSKLYAGLLLYPPKKEITLKSLLNI